MFAASDSTNVAKSRDSWPVPFRCIETNGSDKKAHQGVFIVQGTNLRVSNISLSIDRTTGEVTAAPIQLETSIDVSPEWLKVAIDHAVTAAEIEDEAEVAHHAGDDTALGTQLRQVMREGMQAIAAAAFAIEGFQDGVQARMPVPDTLLQTWRANGTAQHAGGRDAAPSHSRDEQAESSARNDHGGCIPVPKDGRSPLRSVCIAGASPAVRTDYGAQIRRVPCRERGRINPVGCRVDRLLRRPSEASQ